MLLKIIYRSFRNAFAKKKSKGVIFHEHCVIDMNCSFEGYNAVGMFTNLKNTHLGKGSYVGRNNELTSVKIGNFCSIGSFIINTTGNHPSSIFVSTHPAFFSKGRPAGFSFLTENKFNELSYIDEKYLVEIGNDVWIGDRVTILDGVKIGDGAIIGSNALVNKDIEPYTINVGIPARPIKKRFTEKQILELQKIRWWEKEISWIKENVEYFEDIENFIKKNTL